MSLPAEIIPLMEAFRPAFTEPTYQKVIILVIGTILAKGRRTVTAALRVLGCAQAGDWSKYHHVLNRTNWDGLLLSSILLHRIVKTFVAVGAIIYMTVDETLERRWGPQIRKRGHWRDSLASSRQLNVSTSGIRWLVFAVVVQLPWSPYACALPFLCLPLTTPKVSTHLGIHHRTVAKRTMQVVCWLRRQLPGCQLHLMGDGIASPRKRHHANCTVTVGCAPLRGAALSLHGEWQETAGASRQRRRTATHAGRCCHSKAHTLAA